jgi:hypothetical protein
MTVPGLPVAGSDEITYYIWTDIFFGDASLGRMNQFVPQLMFGNVLDESSGPPKYLPKFHNHYQTWVFGAHYYFQIFDDVKKTSESHAAYGPLFSTWPGETLFTNFEIVPSKQDEDQTEGDPQWILTMGVVGDETRISQLIIPRPYMGMGINWDEPSKSWLEPSYKNMCINACWELYGAKDSAHLPSTGTTFEISIVQPSSSSSSSSDSSLVLYYPFTRWEVDEGNGKCPSAKITESHTQQEQYLRIDIDVSPFQTTNKVVAQQQL